MWYPDYIWILGKIHYKINFQVMDGLCTEEMEKIGYLPIIGDELGNMTEVIEDFQF